MPPREVIDPIQNSHGEFLTDFLDLVATNMCMLNGRLGQNDYTGLSPRGRSVVDYCCVPYEQLGVYTDFTVSNSLTIVDKHNLELPRQLSKLPDHAALSCQMDISQWATGSGQRTEQQTETNYIYKVNGVPSDFLSDPNSQAVRDATARLESRLNEENDINAAYNELLDLLSSEMNIKLTRRKVTTGSRRVNRRRRRYQKYWSEQLNAMWSTVCEKEREWRKAARVGRSSRQLKAVFTQARDEFDRESRRARREYHPKQQQDLMNVCSENPQHFWQHLDKAGIGANRKPRIPEEVIDPDGNVVTDPQLVLQRWKRDFQSILTKERVTILTTSI